jgi:hypothetical protein
MHLDGFFGEWSTDDEIYRAACIIDSAAGHTRRFVKVPLHSVRPDGPDTALVDMNEKIVVSRYIEFPNLRVTSARSAAEKP